jgi:hypothetical protein
MAGWQAGDVVRGLYLTARNSATTGIHSDEFARRQGFARAVVAGPNHLTFLCTLLEQELGPPWLQRGRLRARFTAPVYDGDRVRAVVTVLSTLTDGFEAEYQLENEGGTVVAQGTAWFGETEHAAGRPPESSPREELLDLSALEPGEPVPGEVVVATAEAVARFCELNHDPLHRPGRVPTSYLSPLLFAPARRFLDARGVGPGMWGEITVRQFAPLQTDHPYRYRGEVLALRRRGDLEIVEFLFSAADERDTPVCEIDHTHLIPHRERVR